MPDTLQVLIDPEERVKHMEAYLNTLGLFGIQEDINAAYCALPLTSAPVNAQQMIKNYQTAICDMLSSCGITPYDPGTAPFSPDLNLTARPDQIYATDLGRIASSKYFITVASIPSTGVGIEWQNAINLIKVPIVLTSEHVRISRMQPPRTIKLALKNLPSDIPGLSRVLEFLKPFNIGMGFEGNTPVLLGFDTDGKVVNLELATEEEFPEYKYSFDGTQPAAQLILGNPEIFYEI